MKSIKGSVFSLSSDNKPIDYLTISSKIVSDISLFSLGKNTDISSESYPSLSAIYLLFGQMTLNEKTLSEGDFVLIDKNVNARKESKEGAVYLEFNALEEKKMTELLQKGEVLKLKNLLPYQEGKIVNLDVLNTEKAKLSLLAMAKGTSLDAHKAPGEALLFILDGEGIISYEGKEYKVKEGDNFSFAKNGLHALKATTDFKFALLLELC